MKTPGAGPGAPEGRQRGSAGLWHDPVITWDGMVAPCCFDKDAQHKMGNLKEKSFKEIWKNGEYTRFRTQLLKGRKNIDICANCSEGTKVWSD